MNYCMKSAHTTYSIVPQVGICQVLNAPYRLGIDTQSMRTYAASLERSYISLPRSEPFAYVRVRKTVSCICVVN